MTGFTFGESSGATLGESTGGTLSLFVTPPSGLSASTVSNSQIDLSWNYGEEVEKARIFRAQASGTGPGDYTQVDSVAYPTSTYSDTGLLNGERYFYRVAAVESGVQSSLSNEADATTTLPNPVIDTLNPNNDDYITVDWSDNANNSDGHRVVAGWNEGFEPDSFQTWNTPAWSQVTDRVYSGSYAGYQKYDGTAGTVDMATKTVFPGGRKTDGFAYIWQETSYSHGGGIRLVNSSGQKILSLATDNPQWYIEDANGWRNPYSPSDGSYDEWTHFEVRFNWSAGTFDVRFYRDDRNDVYTETGAPLINGGGIESVEIKNFNGGAFTDSQFEMWVDNIRFNNIHITEPDVTAYDAPTLADGQDHSITVDNFTDHKVSWSDPANAVSEVSGHELVLDATIVGENRIWWREHGDDSERDMYLFRSTDGSLGSQIATLSPSTESYTDTNVSEDTRYWYTLRRRTYYASGDEQDSVRTASPIDGPKTSISWYHENDWNAATEEENIVHTDTTFHYDKRNLNLGIDKNRWDSLLAYYVFDENAEILKDYSGNELHGRAENGVTFTHQGINDSYAWFFSESKQSHATLPNLGINGSDSFTVVANIYPFDTTDDGGIFKFGRVDTEEVFSLQTNSTNDQIIYGVLRDQEHTVNVPNLTQSWAQVGAIHDVSKEQKRLWVNGEKEHTASMDVWEMVDHGYYAGGYPFGDKSRTNWSEQYMSELMVFDEALTDSEMQELYDSWTNGRLVTAPRRLR